VNMGFESTVFRKVPLMVRVFPNQQHFLTV